ncbi:hypothetical protein [Streptomyces sp. NPDC008240]|uniref:hypothetical protein n=1 Tax=Streptomyces sp. NPDC008240 TaxID=3364822 RepID=UPI0036E8FDE6
MSLVIIACASGTGRSHTVVEWPAHEASLRDLPLEVRYGSPPNDLRTTAMLVLDLSAAGDDTRPGSGVRLHALHAWELPSCAAGLPFGVPEDDRATWEDHEVQLLADALRPWPGEVTAGSGA